MRAVNAFVDRVMFACTRIAAIAAIACLASTPALATCGDGTLDVDEQCDDGNIEGGDCCLSDCTFTPWYFNCTHDQQGVCFEQLAGQCDGQGGCRPTSYCSGDPFSGPNFFFGAANVQLWDRPETENDRLRWYMHGAYEHYQKGDPPPPGDPTVDTTYTMCLYHQHMDGNLVVTNEMTLPPGADWKKTRTGFQYRLKSPGGGFIYLRAQRYPRVLLRGAAAELPGPVSATQYVDGAAFGIVSSAGACAVGSWPAFGNRVINTPEHYKFRTRAFLD